MKIKYISLCILIFVRINAIAEEYKVIFTNLMITNNAIIKKVYKLGVKSSIYIDEENVELIKNNSVIMDEQYAITSNGRLDKNTLRPISYASEVDGKYELVYSDLKQGLSCSFDVKSAPDFIYLDGKFQFYSLFERKVFEPFPKLQAGMPNNVFGASRDNIMIESGRSVLGAYGLLRGADGNAKHLSIMLIRYEVEGGTCRSSEQGISKGTRPPKSSF